MKKILGLLIMTSAFSLSSLAQNYYKVDSLPKSDSAYHKHKKDTLYTPKRDSTKLKDNNNTYPNSPRREKAGRDTLNKNNTR